MTVNLHVHDVAYPCEGILFDKDGTLLEFLHLWGPWAETMLRQLEEALAERGATFTVDRGDMLGTKHDGAGNIIGYDPQGPFVIATVDESNGLLAGQLYAAGIPWNESITMIRKFSSVAMREVRQNKLAEPIAGLLPFLQQCRDASIPMAVVTSDSTAAAETHLDWMGIRSFFTSIVGSDRVTLGKPDQESVMLACKELHIRPDRAIVIGDSNGDMQMGRSAGASCVIGFCPQDQATDHLHDADVIIRAYEELGLFPNEN
ncbi:HAD family hydrolase [Paenibacillus tundrae]|uniref:HAD family hydrolase n=1 Tax=Paenibacillus tundrae TaxID=528187 RepID=UPI0030CCD801